MKKNDQKTKSVSAASYASGNDLFCTDRELRILTNCRDWIKARVCRLIGSRPGNFISSDVVYGDFHRSWHENVMATLAVMHASGQLRFWKDSGVMGRIVMHLGRPDRTNRFSLGVLWESYTWLQQDYDEQQVS